MLFVSPPGSWLATAVFVWGCVFGSLPQPNKAQRPVGNKSLPLKALPLPVPPACLYDRNGVHFRAHSGWDILPTTTVFLPLSLPFMSPQSVSQSPPSLLTHTLLLSEPRRSA